MFLLIKKRNVKTQGQGRPIGGCSGERRESSGKRRPAKGDLLVVYENVVDNTDIKDVTNEHGDENGVNKGHDENVNEGL
nr:hypothetical protein [Tanacetum cinerariifolium]